MYAPRFVRHVATIAALSVPAAAAVAQNASQLSEETRKYVSVSEPVVALTNVTLIDGTGSAPKTGQTVVIRDGKIEAVGPSSSVQAPEGRARST